MTSTSTTSIDAVGRMRAASSLPWGGAGDVDGLRGRSMVLTAPRARPPSAVTMQRRRGPCGGKSMSRFLAGLSVVDVERLSSGARTPATRRPAPTPTPVLHVAELRPPSPATASPAGAASTRPAFLDLLRSAATAAVHRVPDTAPVAAAKWEQEYGRPGSRASRAASAARARSATPGVIRMHAVPVI
jgi:hypothetical protein